MSNFENTNKQKTKQNKQKYPKDKEATFDDVVQNEI